jgi:RNA polymerase-binding protein
MPPLRTHKTRDHSIFTHEPIRGPDDDLAARQSVAFTCPQGHQFTITFADDAVPPSTWECRQHSVTAERKDALPQEQQPTKARSHTDMLHERRPESELAQLLDTQLKALRAGQLQTVEQWLHQAQEHRQRAREAAGK